MDNEQTPTPTKKSRSGLVVMLAVTCLAAGGGFFFWRSKAVSAAPTPAPPAVKTVVKLESFIVNLSDAEQRSFLRVSMELGLKHELVKGKEEAFPNAAVRDAILGVLTTCRAEELLSVEGKTKLKESLLRTLHERVPELDVLEVYFTDFLVQR